MEEILSFEDILREPLDPSYKLTDQRKAIRKAVKEGFEVITSDPKTLLLDLDTDEAFTQFNKLLPLIQKNFGKFTVRRWQSKSGNIHVRLTGTAPLLHMTGAERVALQSILGSDPKCEALRLARIGKGESEDSAIVLFKPAKDTDTK